MHNHKRKLLPRLSLILAVALLLGSGTAGARGPRVSGSPVFAASGPCPSWHVIPSPSPTPPPGNTTYDSLNGVTTLSPTASWAVGKAKWGMARRAVGWPPVARSPQSPAHCRHGAR
jgi:hypothetical protein